MKNKTLFVPRIEALGQLSLAEASSVVDRDGVQTYIDVINWDEFPTAPPTRLSAAHDGKKLYLHFHVDGDRLLARHGEEQSAVCDDSCVEAFLKPAGSERYLNLEFNCIGVPNAARRLSREVFESLTPSETARIERIGTYIGHPCFAEGEKEGSWDICYALPFDILGIKTDKGSVEMTGNFYSCSSGASQEYYLSWNPIIAPKPDYHRPECFGRIVLL